MNQIELYFSLALWLAGIGHFIILGASFQVPYRLKWKEDLSKLLPLNRKLMWTYGSFTVGAIIAFGVLTLLLHDEILKGDRAALALSGLMGTFWFVRLMVDIFYFEHRDWPAGKAMKMGHGLLVFSFVCFSGTFLGLVIWRVLSP